MPDAIRPLVAWPERRVDAHCPQSRVVVFDYCRMPISRRAMHFAVWHVPIAVRVATPTVLGHDAFDHFAKRVVAIVVLVVGVAIVVIQSELDVRVQRLLHATLSIWHLIVVVVHDARVATVFAIVVVHSVIVVGIQPICCRVAIVASVAVSLRLW